MTAPSQLMAARPRITGHRLGATARLDSGFCDLLHSPPGERPSIDSPPSADLPDYIVVHFLRRSEHRQGTPPIIIPGYVQLRSGCVHPTAISRTKIDGVERE